jgi:hypothetical protein
MEFTLYDKMKYYTKYLYDTYYLKMFPYKSVFIYDDMENIENTKDTKDIKEELRVNHYYKNNTQRLNYISWGYDYSYNFEKKRKIIVDYSGNKEFNVAFFAESHNEINNIIKEILENESSVHKKIKTKFPNFIENIYFVKKDGEEQEVTEIINNSIEYNNNTITFFDIASLSQIDTNNIETIKIVYVKMIKKLTKEFNFEEYKNKDISILNEIYSQKD